MKPVLWMAIACWIALLPPGKAAAQNAGAFVPPQTLVVGLDDDYAPYSFLPQHGELQGIMRDLWDLWSRRTGVTVRYEAVKNSGRLQALDSGEVDVAGYLIGSEKRRENYL